MPTMTAEARAKAKQTRARNNADKPLYALSKVLKTKPSTLRARLYYHKQKIEGASLRTLVKTLETKCREPLTPAQLRALGLGDAAPPVLSNPRAAPPAAAADSSVRARNLKYAIIALSSVEKMILPDVNAGRYSWRELWELEALAYLRRLDQDNGWEAEALEYLQKLREGLPES